MTRAEEEAELEEAQAEAEALLAAEAVRAAPSMPAPKCGRQPRRPHIPSERDGRHSTEIAGGVADVSAAEADRGGSAGVNRRICRRSPTC